MTEPLTITTSPRPDRQVELTIQLGPERTEQALQRAARQVAKKVNIPGFRRGKAPYQTVLRQFGREALLNEIVDELGQEVYKEALDIEKIDPFAQAQLEDVEFDPPTFKLVVPLAPAVDLKDYRDIRVEAPEVSVTDADVEQVINDQRSTRTTWVEIDRPAEMGDSLTLDIKGTVGEETIMDNHDWDLLLKEEAGWLPGFAEAFVGLKAGDEKAFTLTYPEDSASRYKGQEASFQATVKQVKARLEPELNDEFVKSLGDYQDVEDYKAKTREQLTRQRTTEAENKLNESALNALIEQAELSYPPAAVEETLDEMLEEVRRNLSRSGYSLEDFVRLQSMTVDDYKERLRESAEKRLQGRLVLGRLAADERIRVSDEDIHVEIDRMAPADSENEQALAMREVLESEAGHAMIYQDVLTDKTLARLRAIVTGQAPELPAEATGAEAPEAEGAEAGTEAREPEASGVEAETPAEEAPEAAPASTEAGEDEEIASTEPSRQDEVTTWEGGTAVGDASQAAEEADEAGESEEEQAESAES